VGDQLPVGYDDPTAVTADPPPPKKEEKLQDCAPPTLTVEPNWPPVLTGDLPHDDGPEPPMPYGGPFTVTPNTIRDAEGNILLKGIDPATDRYTQLRDYITANKSWLLKFPSADWNPVSDSDNFYHPNSTVPRARKPSEYLGDTPDQLTAEMDLVLTACGNALAVAARHVGLLNLAGQTFVHADKQSYFPGT
jgi:hypothetical protein